MFREPPNGYARAMFRCDHCQTEYGGIRGLTSGTCPRCRPQSEAVQEPRTPATSWRSPRLTGPSWSALASPLLSPLAELDRAARL
jgi:hypothetical protein